MKNSVVFLLLVTLSGADCHAVNKWRPFPIWGGGYIMNVMMAPSNANVWYATVDVGGPYRSDDAGKTWRPLHIESRLKDCGHYASMARGLSVDPRNCDSFVIATGTDPKKGGSLVVSRDGGQTFRRTGTGFFRSNGTTRMHGLVLDRSPFNPDELIAGEYLDGFHISSDNGETWRDFGPTNYWFTDVRYDLMRRGIVYACAPRYEGRGGFFCSEDGGRSWKRFSEDAPTEICQIKGCGDIIGLFHDRIRVSADSGRTWNDYSDGLILENRVTDGDPNPSKSTGVYIAAGAGSSFYLAGNRRGDIFSRRPGDAYWRMTPRKSQSPGDPAAEHSIRWSCKRKKMDALCSVIVDPKDDRHWLTCDWHVIWESLDAGLNWTTRVKGLPPLCPFIVRGSPSRKDVIMYGVADMGMYVSVDNGKSFRPVRETSGVNSIAFSSLHPETGYAVGGKFTTDLIRTDDGGASWRKLEGLRGLPRMKPKKLAAYSVAVDPLSDEVWLAVSGPCRPGEGGVYRSRDGGSSWEWAANGLPEGADLFKCSEFAPGHADSQLVFSPDGSFLTCSQKTGLVARFIRETQSWERTDKHVWGTRIFADPHVPGRFILAERQAEESLDGGRTFHPYPSVPTGSWSMSFDPERRGLLVVGNSRGLCVSRDGGATFQPLAGSLDLPSNGSRVTALDRGRLFFLTFGAGVWVRDI